MATPRPRKRRSALGPSTLGVHGGAEDAVVGQPIVPPIVQSSTFVGGFPDDDGELRYSRYGNNPNQLQVGRKLAALEGTEDALVLSSGMAAVAMAILALTRAGDHVVASEHLYGATRILLRDELPRRGIEVSFVDPGAPREWRRALRPTTRLVYLEAPTNPTLRVFDPRPLAAMAHDAGLVFAMDATFASPVNLRPVELGVDVVIHSATKYLGGHSDLIAGVVASTRGVIEEVTRVMRLYGPAPDPLACWLLDRGLRTLDVRVSRQNANALDLARWLEGRPEVARVIHPGLESHPDHAVAAAIFEGFGGMLSLVVHGGDDAAREVMERFQLIAVAPSLGGVESLASMPRYTSHVALTRDQRLAAGIADGFLRLS
ncbi:MAG: aminotransferase class I/II-fold pyridoxal phosphate-dependent enzyme, partial [Gemmatimonadetes bacterium]|nr:aminotransferase class I/II-fold pyridoxal phosphate-dependent enzyme [Gemmatimonadota bacterium]